MPTKWKTPDEICKSPQDQSLENGVKTVLLLRCSGVESSLVVYLRIDNVSVEF